MSKEKGVGNCTECPSAMLYELRGRGAIFVCNNPEAFEYGNHVDRGIVKCNKARCVK